MTEWLLNFIASCQISGDFSPDPMTPIDAAINIANWIIEDPSIAIEFSDISPRQFANNWNLLAMINRKEV